MALPTYSIFLFFFLFHFFSHFFLSFSSPSFLSSQDHSLSSLHLSLTASPKQHRPTTVLPVHWLQSLEGVETLGPGSLAFDWGVGNTETSRRWNNVLQPFFPVNLGSFVFSTSSSSQWCLHFPMKVIGSLARIFVQMKTLQVDSSQTESYFKVMI